MLYKKNRKGQNILEYIIVVTAVIAIILWGAATFIKPAVNKTLGDANWMVENVSGKLY